MIAWAAAACVAFRSFVLSSFDLISGDRGDGRLIVYLHEHLYNALLGREQFLSPPFFYPQRDILGLSDAFLLDALPYSAFRILGFDPFLSFQLWATVLSLGCFLCSLTIAIRYLKLRPCFAICASILLTFPNNLIFKVNVGHIQFFSVYYIPCILLIALWGLEDFPRLSRWSLMRIAIAAALFGLLFSTGYYTAWMFSVTAAIALCTAGVIYRRDLFVMITNNYIATRRLVAVATISFVFGLIPFMLIYAPTLALVHGRSFRDFISFAPFPKDVIDVGEWNMVWGWLVQRLIGDGGPERTLAVAPGMTVIFIILVYRLRVVARDSKRDNWQLTFATASLAVWSVSWLMTTRIGTFSLFWLPYHLIPGATAIRAGGRLQLFVNMWVVASLVLMLQYWIDTSAPLNRRRNTLLSGAILAFCLIEQINLMPARLSRSHELEWLSAVPKPPVECQVFVVNVSGRTANDLDENDAMWISWQVGKPTINGNSGWIPPGWRLEDPSIDYRDAVQQWISASHLDQVVCVYDRASTRWTRF